MSIIDLATGHQPIHNADESIWIVFNGEIYNYQSLERKLTGLGHKLYTTSDTEVIVHAYEEDGEDCVKKLAGIVAFAIWDSSKKQLLLARDRIGVRSLYFWRNDGMMAFASEIKAILSLAFVERKLYLDALYHCLTFLSVPHPETIFDCIHKIQPGQVMIAKPDCEAKKKTYWDLSHNRLDLSPGEKEVVKKTGSLLEDSVKQRMIADVPVGAFLSGGIDSSTVVALMSQLSDERVRTFSIGYEGVERLDELADARFIAEHFETQHKKTYIDNADLVKLLPKLVYHQDEPIADPVCIPILCPAEMASEQSVPFVQVGEGSDELFCGYPAYVSYLRSHLSFFGPYSRLPGPVKKVTSLAFRSFAKHSYTTKKIGERLETSAQGKNLPPRIKVFGEEKKRILSQSASQGTASLNSSLIRQTTIHVQTPRHAQEADVFL